MRDTPALQSSASVAQPHTGEEKKPPRAALPVGPVAEVDTVRKRDVPSVDLGDEQAGEQRLSGDLAGQ